MKKKIISIIVMLVMGCWAAIAGAATTATLTDNRIIITGDPVPDNGDFDVWAALGLTVGKDKYVIEYFCWYGSNIVANDVCEIETADGAPIGVPMIAVTAAQSLCHPPINRAFDRLYVDQLSHGSIIIFVHRVGEVRE